MGAAGRERWEGTGSKEGLRAGSGQRWGLKGKGRVRKWESQIMGRESS